MSVDNARFPTIISENAMVGDKKGFFSVSLYENEILGEFYFLMASYCGFPSAIPINEKS